MRRLIGKKVTAEADAKQHERRGQRRQNEIFHGNTVITPSEITAMRKYSVHELLHNAHNNE